MGQIEEAVARIAKFRDNSFFERHCHGKIAFPSEREAKKQAKRIHKIKKKQYDAYRCKFCSQWHIGGRMK